MCNYFLVFDNFEMKFAVMQREFKNDELDKKHFRISQKSKVLFFLY